MFIFAPPKYLPSFARAFGYMNMIGVIIQLFFPCSPPWYENKYGLAAANYSIPGSPAGLARVDELFGLGLYTTTFSASPLVFGAFPSLHSGNATLEALFMANLFPKLTPLFIAYVMWLWWSTMYLAHHYAVDLVVGSIRKSISHHINVCSHQLTLLQLPVFAFSSPRRSSYHACNGIRNSDGTTTTSRSVTCQKPTVYHRRRVSTRNSTRLAIAMNGLSARQVPARVGVVVQAAGPEAQPTICGKVTHWLAVAAAMSNVANDKPQYFPSNEPFRFFSAHTMLQPFQ